MYRNQPVSKGEINLYQTEHDILQQQYGNLQNTTNQQNITGLNPSNQRGQSNMQQPQQLKFANIDADKAQQKDQKNPGENKKHKKKHKHRKSKEEKQNMVKFRSFFRFLTKKDKALLILGTISAIISGVLTPSIALLLGQITETFDPSSDSDIIDKTGDLAGILSLIGLGLWIFGYIYYAFWQHLAENISYDLRSRYLHAIMKQEVAYFETQNVEQLPSQIGENFALIQDSVGEKFANIIYILVCLLAGIGIAFYKGADFAAICLAYFPVIMIILTIFSVKVKKSAMEKMTVTKKMRGIVEESLSAIRLIISFAQEERELKKFDALAQEVRKVTQKAECWLGAFIGAFRFSIFGFYVYSFWLATVYIQVNKENPNTKEPYTVDDLLSILVALMTGMALMFGLNPNVQAIVKAKVVGATIFEVIDRTPLINDHENCVEDFTLDESIRFENVTFKYPLAAEKVKNVLEHANFSIKAGTTTAIVGPSGSGKSTIIQMIERFYDPKEGEIFLDNTNLRDIKLKSLRENIGYVSQEPVLLLGTIRDNLLLGKKDATQEDLDYAIKLANASFVYDMENGLDTFCGSSAVLNLSGGQKQRIAIARALITRPKILILDEATSALDPKSEKDVQDAIDQIANDEEHKLTIIMIAHRLQTIMTAKNLLYIENKSSVVPAEKGTNEYDEIIRRLKETNYAHQQEEDSNDNNIVESQEQNVEKLQEPNDVNDDINNDDEQIVQMQEAQNQQQAMQLQKARGPPKKVGLKKIMSYYRPKWLTYLSYIASALNSVAFPVYGLIFAHLLFVMLDPQNPNYKRDRTIWCLCFIALCIYVAVFSFVVKSLYSYLGENLTYTVRTKLYESILYKHLGWFDNKERAPGILSNVLSEDISQLNGLTSETIGNLMEAFLCLVVGIVLCFVYSWKIALVSLGVAPFVVVGGVIMSRLQFNVKKTQGQVRDAGEEDPYEQSNALLSDMLINYRTVISFGEKNIEQVMNKFDSLLEGPKKQGIRNAHISGFWFGYSQSIRFFFLAFIFYISAIFVNKQGDPPDDTYIGVYIIFVAALGSGISISQAPSVSKAKHAASKVFEIIEEESQIDSRSKEGEMLIKEGEIELKNVTFRYPSRVKNVLNKINLKIPATKKIALVGHSGCGKSTIASLLLRMYDITDGEFLIDGIDIRKYNVKALRQQIGIVMQEPLLFNMTIKENILYGNENASDQRVREVAELANALTFIEQDIEDLSKEQLQEKMENRFRNAINNDIIMQNYPNFQVLLQKYFNEQAFGIEVIQIIVDIIEKGDDNILALINNNMERFCEILEDLNGIKTIKWDDVLLGFEWTFFADQIEDYINSGQSQVIQNEHIDVITDALDKYPMKLDMQTIQEFEQLLMKQQNPEQDIQEVLNIAIKNSQERLKHYKYERINSIIKKDNNSKDFKLHDGFNKNCGLKGSLLSGGQKQRIAIARALIKDPKILILDEATSALDEQSQELVQQALDRAMEGRTSVVIAHRLSTIRNCEWLFVIHNGQVAEQGTYDELSANPKSYFYKLKSGMEM